MNDATDAPPTGSSRRPAVVVGLGNPGERYRDTRHNLGFLVVDELARRWNVPLAGEECRARVGEGASPGGRPVLLVQPLTYMNRSGWSLRCLAEARDLEAGHFLVAYDEVQLPLGRLRLRPKGGPGGHRGMESVVENLRTDRVARLRLGCHGEAGPPDGEQLVDYVLSPFEPDETEAVEALVERAADACATWVDEGVEAAMNRHNA